MDEYYLKRIAEELFEIKWSLRYQFLGKTIFVGWTVIFLLCGGSKYLF